MIPGRSMSVRSGHSLEKTELVVNGTSKLDGVVDDTFPLSCDLIGKLLDFDANLIEVGVLGIGLNGEYSIGLGFG